MSATTTHSQTVTGVGGPPGSDMYIESGAGGRRTDVIANTGTNSVSTTLVETFDFYFDPPAPAMAGITSVGIQGSGNFTTPSFAASWILEDTGANLTVQFTAGSSGTVKPAGTSIFVTVDTPMVVNPNPHGLPWPVTYSAGFTSFILDGTSTSSANQEVLTINYNAHF